MFSQRNYVLLLTILSLGMLLVSCQSQTDDSQDFQWKPLYGDGFHDTTPVIARVGDLEITQKDLDLHFDELPRQLKSQYQGEEGQRLLLKTMVEQSLMVIGAVQKGLYNDTDVSRTLISQRRVTLDAAMRNYGVLRDNDPTEEEIKQYFDNNRARFRQQGLVEARHIECLSKAEADQAYTRLMQGGRGNDFLHVIKDYSKNIESAANSGELGWFNKGGAIPFVEGSMALTNKIFDLEIGVHPPLRVAERWHIVEILNREHGRPMTYREAKDKVILAMTPGHQDGLIKDYLAQARKEHPVVLMGEFAPGKGIGPDVLFARGMALAEPEAKVDMLMLVVSDFPDHEKADDALFMCAMVALDSWQDRRVAERYILQLIEDYPDSDLREDAQFLKDNLYNPKAMSPSSIEELRNNQ